MIFQDLRTVRFANEHWRPLCRSCTFSASQRTPIGFLNLVCKPIFLLIWEFHIHSSHWYPMRVRAADVVHRKELFACRFFMTMKDEQRAVHSEVAFR